MITLKIPVDNETRFLWVLDVLGCISPFKDMRPKEKLVLSRLLKLTYELRHIPKEQRDLLILHQDNKIRIATELGMSVDNYYNIVMSLRKKGVMGDKGVEDHYFDRIVSALDGITFNFIANGNI